MIKINDVEYRVDKVKISWGEFCISSKNKIRKGISPTIQFYICDKIIQLETIFSDNDISALKINESIDFAKYLSDIYFEEKTLMDKDFKIMLTKITNDKYKIALNSDYNIIIEEEFTLI